ncbi:hypothetical protein BsWGS_03966 [Bradybaena similaris]
MYKDTSSQNQLTVAGEPHTSETQLLVYHIHLRLCCWCNIYWSATHRLVRTTNIRLPTTEDTGLRNSDLAKQLTFETDSLL